jgi:lipopolysaccharide transport system ATP-binding protein
MPNTVIRVENLSKNYIISHQQEGQRYKALRDVITNNVRSAFKKLNPLRQDPQLQSQNPSKEEFWALKDVSFEIKQGERVGVIGRNGAGKSTLLKILSRITEPSHGSIRIKGRVASLLEVGTGFHPELTGRENIFLNGAILGMNRLEIQRKFDEIVAFAEIEKFLDTPVKRYSSGMYVRLAFAVAAHLEPEILIVDEVLAVGDAQFQKKCLGKMEAVGQEGRTVLFVSHNMTAVQKLCSSAILLNKGQIQISSDVNSVINAYLNTHNSHILERTYDKFHDAPGNECIRIRSIKVSTDPSGLTEDIQTNTDIYIECYFWFLSKKRRKVMLAMHLSTVEGDCVFASCSPSSDLEEGLYKETCYIPGNLLNDGTYKVSILFVEEEITWLYKFDDALSFEIKDYREINASWKWPGAVRPILNWDFEQISVDDSHTPMVAVTQKLQ